MSAIRQTAERPLPLYYQHKKGAVKKALSAKAVPS